MISLERDSKSGVPAWTYSTATVRAMDNSTSNRISWVDGLGLSTADVLVAVPMNETGSSAGCLIGTDLDSTSAAPHVVANTPNSVIEHPTAQDTFFPQIGLHFVQAIEYAAGGACNFYSNTTIANQQWLQLRLAM